MSWKQRALLFKTLSVIPGSARLAEYYRVHFGRMSSFSVSNRFDAAAKMLEMMRMAKVDLPRASLLEIGCGWQPTLPIVLYLAGARDILISDLKRSLTDRTAASALRQYPGYADQLATLVGRSANKFVMTCRLSLNWRVSDGRPA